MLMDYTAASDTFGMKHRCIDLDRPDDWGSTLLMVQGIVAYWRPYNHCLRSGELRSFMIDASEVEILQQLSDLLIVFKTFLAKIGVTR